ncbi:MAG: bifunctional diaminohydroxyphosphoribosylaminopyrimidine deaminase/5-amino-6-(5-phosphoribosylamino)uracil reductase RibD [Planctomycetota bacterium]
MGVVPGQTEDVRLERRMLDLAARSAMRAAGHVEPNPMVGCVLARGDEVLAIGHHQRFGELHAEREALKAAREAGVDVRGCTAYVTLEPCSHHGKQPPCCDALIEAGVGNVVMARRDPGPASSGGIELLEPAGIGCRVSEASAMAAALAEPFVKRVLTGLPWVTAKWAQTIDGRVATRTGESKWISGEAARRRVHVRRARTDIMLTALGTVLADDPMLTPRGVHVRRMPRRVIVDRDLDIPLESALVRTAEDVPTVIACDKVLARASITEKKRTALEAAGCEIAGVPQGPGGVDLRLLMEHLVREYDAMNVMVEAGPGLLGSLFEADLVDEAVVYVAPLLLGDEMARSVISGRVAASLANGKAMRLVRIKPIAGDVELTYRRPRVEDLIES